MDCSPSFALPCTNEARKRETNTATVEYNLEVDHRLDPDTCGRLAVGVIKYILYNREQIPSPFDELEKLCRADVNSKEVTSINGARHRQRQNKLTAFVSDLQKLFYHLTEMFSHTNLTQIHRVALVLGPSATPKEVHCIDFPVNLPWSETSGPLIDLFCQQRHLAQAFRTLIVSDNARTWPSLNPTNIAVLVLMRRDCHSSWFEPRTLFQLPERGLHTTYRVSSSVPVCSRVASADAALRPEPMFQVYECPMTSLPAPAFAQRDVSSLNDVAGRLGDLSVAETVGASPEDFIWFQMPVTVKGLSFVS